MNDLVVLWLSISVSGAMVTLVLILLRPLLRRLSRTWQYYLWLLVILRMLIPFSPDVSVVGGLFQQAGTHLERKEATAENHMQDSQPDIMQGVNGNDRDGLEVPGTQKAPLTARNYSFVKDNIVGAVWLAAAVFLLIRKVSGYGQFLKAVKKESMAASDALVNGPLQKVLTEMGIKKRVNVCVNPLVRAPMLIGIRKPVIVLPSEAIDEEEMTYIFRHELTHFRRGDFLYKWLAEITVCLHWFNPFAYWVRRQINRDCEFSCDEAVIASDPAGRLTYGDTLLNTIAVNKGFGKDIMSLSLNGDGKFLKERLRAIMKYKQKSKIIVILAVVLTSVLLCVTVYAGAYTMKKADNETVTEGTNPIRISNKDLEPEGKISLGSQHLSAGMQCRVSLNWTGGDGLTVLCTLSDGVETSSIVESGAETVFGIDTEGEYTVAVINHGDSIIQNISGSISFEQIAEKPVPQSTDVPVQADTENTQIVVYENVEMRRYEGEDGHPYVHSIKRNDTDRKIVGCLQGMLAFDRDGNPLEIDWDSMDSDLDSTYFNLYEDTFFEIAPGEKDDKYGGWSLNIMGNDPVVDDIAYVLYCDKEITFEDGTVWDNPDFEKWLSTYEGNKINVDILENYYPYEQEIVF